MNTTTIWISEDITNLRESIHKKILKTKMTEGGSMNFAGEICRIKIKEEHCVLEENDYLFLSSSANVTE